MCELMKCKIFPTYTSCLSYILSFRRTYSLQSFVCRITIMHETLKSRIKIMYGNVCGWARCYHSFFTHIICFVLPPSRRMWWMMGCFCDGAIFCQLTAHVRTTTVNKSRLVDREFYIIWSTVFTHTTINIRDEE